MDTTITRADVVIPVPTDSTGLHGPTKGQARGAGWRRTSPGLYVPARVEPTLTAQRIVEAWAGAPQGTAVTGWAALHWLGAEWFPGTASDRSLLPVPLALGDRQHTPRRPGVLPCHEWLFDDDVRESDGLPLTRPERSAVAEMVRARTFEEAVQVADMAVGSGVMTLPELIEYTERLRGRPRSRRLLSAVGEARENVWSPMETTLRLHWLTLRPAAHLLCNTPILSTAGQLDSTC
ncbi:hypothetical protein [Nocardioides yefusunii]|uniref:AbiEi antitoxin C-terminal domain-containing protein n=1 Tax=Nocardioides yefusunii TaxID=2500546 RepID=A0ABW1R047_9ACTN|nr:hypothetical protein [Nocardioides yefusunii]